jgi:hypothetical protein
MQRREESGERARLLVGAVPLLLAVVGIGHIRPLGVEAGNLAHARVRVGAAAQPEMPEHVIEQRGVDPARHHLPRPQPLVHESPLSKRHARRDARRLVAGGHEMLGGRRPAHPVFSGPVAACILAHVPAKHALGLDPGVDAGSPTRTCASERIESMFRFRRNGTRSSETQPIFE